MHSPDPPSKIESLSVSSTKISKRDSAVGILGGRAGNYTSSGDTKNPGKLRGKRRTLNKDNVGILAQPSTLGDSKPDGFVGKKSNKDSDSSTELMKKDEKKHRLTQNNGGHGVVGGININIVSRLNQIPALSKLGAIVRGPRVQFVTFLSVMWALFAQDICFGWVTDKAIDSGFAAVTILVFVILACEMIVHTFLTKNYFGSYFMVIDLVGTFLLIPEIFVYQTSDDHYSSDETADSILGVARAGRVARTAAMVRVGRIAKIVRVLRTARAMQCLLMLHSWSEARKRAKQKAERKKRQSDARERSAREPEAASIEDEDDDEDSRLDAKPSAFGLKYANLVSQRVVIGVLLILAVVPQLDVQEYDASRENSLDFLRMWGMSCSTSTDQSQCETSQDAAGIDFLSRFSNCLYLENFGQVLYNDADTLDLRRKTVMTKYEQGTAAGGDFVMAIFDDQKMETEVRVMNILLTLFVVMIFSVGSWIFNNDAKTMIIRPIERLTQLVKKLAGMVFVLSAEEEGEGDSMAEGNELDFIDLIADKMSNVFERDDKLNKKADKVTGKLLPSEMSPARGGRRICPTNDADEKMDAATNDRLVHARPELQDLKACLQDSKARSYFRLFLSREFNVENIAFWEAVHEYKVLFKKRAKFIYTTYISQAAVSQVNIPASQRARIKEMLTKDVTECNIAMFDLANEEIFRLMARDPFPRFLKSDLAVTFAKIAQNEKHVNVEGPGSKSGAEGGERLSGTAKKKGRRKSQAELVEML